MRCFFFQADINRNIGLLTEKESELEKLVSSHGDDGGCIDVDNAVVTTAPLYQQYDLILLINLYAIVRLRFVLDIHSTTS